MIAMYVAVRRPVRAFKNTPRRRTGSGWNPVEMMAEIIAREEAT
ncbi:MAG TPA: hypothetical protein VGA84_07895 [Thermoanaerobaculia bacterium]